MTYIKIYLILTSLIYQSSMKMNHFLIFIFFIIALPSNAQHIIEKRTYIAKKITEEAIPKVDGILDDVVL